LQSEHQVLIAFHKFKSIY